MPTTESLLEKNLAAVRARLECAAAAAGRAPGSIELLAVTKSVAPDVALALARLGQRALGENRLAPFEQKRAAFERAGECATWHFVGHVQTNKLRRVARLADVLHSVDSLRLVDALARLGDELGADGRAPEIYLQVNVAREPQKHGLEPEATAGALARAVDAGLTVRGLMTMAPLGGGRPAARAAFDGLAALARELDANAFEGGSPRLSMGMSGDLEEAVAAGAHVVRVGTALFEGLGERADARENEARGDAPA
jgi:hypothetical protein